MTDTKKIAAKAEATSEVFVFDAYGTLFDVHSAVARHGSILGANAAQVSQIWRNKQLEYSWVLTAMGRYRDFWTLTSEALRYALQTVPDADANAHELLMQAYETLSCYDEVPGVLQALKREGKKTAILSNGSPQMLEKAVSAAGIDQFLDDVFSVDQVAIFKTAPETYGLVTQCYGVAPEEVSFQSSNRWDIAGACAFGFSCNWINRSGQADEYADLPPKRILSDLSGLLSCV